jgi:hypothetical protein
VAKVTEEEVLLLWRALSVFRTGRQPACAPDGNGVATCPLLHSCPRWEEPDDYAASLDEEVATTDRRRARWPCSRVLGLLGPETRRIG